jgi:hypothetical protein
MVEARLVLSAEDRASAALKQVRGRVEELRAAQDKLTSVTGSIGGPLASIAALFTAGGLIGGIKTLTSTLDDLDEAAQGIGVSAVALAEFRLAAGEAGVKSEQLDKALGGLASRMADAAEGGKESAAIFQTLGISVRNSSGQLKTTEEVLADIATAFASYRDGAAKTALANALFGEKLGRVLIPYLNQGAEGLRKFAGVTTEAVAEAAKLAKEFDSLAANSEVLKNNLARVLIPFINKTIEEFNAATAAAGGFGAALALLGKQSSETLADPGAKIAALTTELAKLQKIAAEPAGLSWGGQRQRDLAAARIEDLQVELRFLKELQRNRALANAGTPYSNEGRAGAKGEAPRVPKPVAADKEQKEAISESSRALAQFIDQLEKERDKLEEISNVEKGLNLLRELGAVGQIPQVRQMVLEQARLADELKNEADMRKVVAEAIRDQAQAERQLRDQVLDLAGITDDNRKRAQTAQLEKMIGEGILSPEQAERAVKGIAGIKDELEKTSDVAEQFALVMTSALSDFFKNPTSAKSFFKALEADIMQLITQLLILKPLAEAIKGTFSSGDLVGSFVGAFNSAGSGFGKLFEGFGKLFSGFFAEGGFIPAGQWGVVGERGPEPAFGGRTGLTVAPAMAGGGHTINITLAGNATRESAYQIGAEVSRALTRANARYN